jgi:aminomethyltransferase
MPLHTPLHIRTSALNEGYDWQDWSGFLSANMYELDHIHEYNAVRIAAALFDISPLYKYYVRGRDAQALLDRMVTRDLSKLRNGQVMYTAWCDDDGKIIDDGTVARLGDDFFRVTAAIPSLAWLQDVGFRLDADIQDVTEQMAGLSLQGPTSRGVLARVADLDVSELAYFRIAEAKIAGNPAWISRTGYTGDLGYEIFVRPSDAVATWDALMEAGSAFALRPAGNVALDMLRIEAGLLLLDADFHSAKQTFFEVQRTTPFELGLDWMVKLSKGYFIGRDALRREKQRGPAWTTVGIEIDLLALERVYARFSMPLHLPYTSWNDEIPIYADADKRRHVGRATSGTWSPILKKYVAICRLRPDLAAPGARVFFEATVEGERFAVPATVVKLPFFDPPRKRA